jgi:hypothetical protein
MGQLIASSKLRVKMGCFSIDKVVQNPYKIQRLQALFRGFVPIIRLFRLRDFRAWQAILQADSECRQITGTRSPSGAPAHAPNRIP